MVPQSSSMSPVYKTAPGCWSLECRILCSLVEPMSEVITRPLWCRQSWPTALVPQCSSPGRLFSYSLPSAGCGVPLLGQNQGDLLLQIDSRNLLREEEQQQLWSTSSVAGALVIFFLGPTFPPTTPMLPLAHSAVSSEVSLHALQPQEQVFSFQAGVKRRDQALDPLLEINNQQTWSAPTIQHRQHNKRTDGNRKPTLTPFIRLHLLKRFISTHQSAGSSKALKAIQKSYHWGGVGTFSCCCSLLPAAAISSERLGSDLTAPPRCLSESTLVCLLLLVSAITILSMCVMLTWTHVVYFWFSCHYHYT